MISVFFEDPNDEPIQYCTAAVNDEAATPMRVTNASCALSPILYVIQRASAKITATKIDTATLPYSLMILTNLSDSGFTGVISGLTGGVVTVVSLIYISLM